MALCADAPALAGQGQTLFGPPAPVAPAVITRDDEGRATVRAFRLPQPLRLDGQLDEPLYREVAPMSDFIQMEPINGAPATERTEASIVPANGDLLIRTHQALWCIGPGRLADQP